jgi:hypothetical protein
VSFTRNELKRVATEVCVGLDLDPDDVYRLVLYARKDVADSGPLGAPAVTAYLYKRDDGGKKYLDAGGGVAHETRDFWELAE